MSERGLAPDARDIADLAAIDRCPHCEAAPAVVLITHGEDECYHCGGEVRV